MLFAGLAMLDSLRKDPVYKDITVLGTNIVKQISRCLDHTLVKAKNTPEETEPPLQNHNSEENTSHSTDRFINHSD